MSKRLISSVLSLCFALSLFLPLRAAPPTQLTFPATGTVLANANVRSGPGTNNGVVGSVAVDQVVTITACNTDCTWYQIGEGQWVAAFLVEVGDVVAAPLVPTATPQATALATTGFTLTVVSWNVESGGALQTVVADRIGSFDGVDIWALSEVIAVDAEAFEFGAEEGEGVDFETVLGTTGGADRLQIIYDTSRFEQVNTGQMTNIAENGRAPLWVQLRDRSTGTEFIVMANHLHRSNEDARHRQATALNQWAATQTLPVVALGDYNFDWNLPNGDSDHDQGYDNLTANGVWEWVRPAELVTTQCSGWPCSYNSVLDFVFVAGPARDWQATSEIIVTANDFPDDNTTPDHRPVRAVLGTTGSSFVLPPGSATGPSVAPAPDVAGIAPEVTVEAEPDASACPQANGGINVRSGPGTNYDVVGRLTDGQCVTITGRNNEGNWYQLDNGNWVAAFLIVNAPTVSATPIMAVPAAPTVLPTLAPVATVAATEAPAVEQPTAVPPTATPVPPTPIPPTPVPAQPACDPNYTGACIPIVSGDLNCPDVGVKDFNSVGSDPHGFDRDGDGLACES